MCLENGMRSYRTMYPLFFVVVPGAFYALYSRVAETGAHELAVYGGHIVEPGAWRAPR